MRQQSSFWLTEENKRYPMLRGRRSADAVVVGGGLSGLTTALWLCKAGLRVSLLEAGRIGQGASQYGAGIVSLAGGMRCATLEKQMGARALEGYLSTQQSAFSSLRELCRDTGADWQDVDAQLVSGDKAGETLLSREAELMARAGISASVVKPTQCPLPAEHVLLLRDMAVIHPAKHMHGLAASAEKLGLTIYEDSRVTAIETNLAYTERGSVLAPYLVIATGYPIVNVPGWYFMRLIQRRHLLAPIAQSAAFDGMYIDAGGRYALRRLRDGALLQLNGTRSGSDTDARERERYFADYAPYLGGSAQQSFYHGLEVYSPDGLPYVGAYSRKTPNLFVATGYCGRGLLGSMVAAQAISAAILGLPTEAYALYGGSRHAGGEGVRAALGIGARYIGSQLRLRAPRCPHMGCKLVYRRNARIWECPCHGSRFDDIGHVINAPAVENARIDRR